MAFGQVSGPPAGGRQLDELAGLLERAGYSSFKEARHPFGLTQRQAGGKFTVGEAAELIERLQAAETVQLGETGPVDGGGAPRPTRARPRPAASTEAQRARADRQLATVRAAADQLLVDELERRGWCCIPPVGTLEERPT